VENSGSARQATDGKRIKLKHFEGWIIKAKTYTHNI
jgi:hypothetical protein